MYFESRSHAGHLLANMLRDKYRYENCAILAVSPGGVLVGEQIAAQLHAPLMMLLSENIAIPGESLAIGAVSEGGNFAYNSELSEGEIEEFNSEFYSYFADKRREAFSHLNRLVGDGGILDEKLLKDRHVVIVSDGYYDLAPIDVVLEFLKPIRTGKLIFVAPIATIPVVDRLHIAADELHILDVKVNFFGVNHYYEDNTMPPVEQFIEKLNQIVLNWR